jgi:hypothetical protein
MTVFLPKPEELWGDSNSDIHPKKYIDMQSFAAAEGTTP